MRAAVSRDFLADLCEPMPVAKKVAWLLRNNYVIVIKDIAVLQRPVLEPISPDLEPRILPEKTPWPGGNLR